MDKKQGKYWYENLDRLGIFFGGIFLGAMFELTGIRNLGIIVGVAGMVCISILLFVIKKFVLTRQGVSNG